MEGIKQSNLLLLLFDCTLQKVILVFLHTSITTTMIIYVSFFNFSFYPTFGGTFSPRSDPTSLDFIITIAPNT